MIEKVFNLKRTFKRIDFEIAVLENLLNENSEKVDIEGEEFFLINMQLNSMKTQRSILKRRIEINNGGF